MIRDCNKLIYKISTQCYFVKLFESEIVGSILDYMYRLIKDVCLAPNLVITNNEVHCTCFFAYVNVFLLNYTPRS